MKTQNYTNHIRVVPTYHYLTYGGILAALTGTILYFYMGENDTTLLSLVLLTLTLSVLSVAFHARGFALKAQDRAIRAEENLRYFILTGKRMDPDLRLGQIIALRFASDQEFVNLAERAVNEKLSPKEIKKAVKNWRGDYRRV